MSLLEVLGGDADRTGNRVRHRLHIERRAEIDDERRFGAVEPGFEAPPPTLARSSDCAASAGAGST